MYKAPMFKPKYLRKVEMTTPGRKNRTCPS